MSDPTKVASTVERFKRHLDEHDAAHRKFRKSAEYKAWEQGLARDIATIKESRRGSNPEEIFSMEIACIENDMILCKKLENEMGARRAKSNMFQCICALNFLQYMKKNPQDYMSIAKECTFDSPVRLPRADPFIASCLHMYTQLCQHCEQGGSISLYDFTPYYAVRKDNLRIALRAHRRWQKKVLRGEE